MNATLVSGSYSFYGKRSTEQTFDFFWNGLCLANIELMTPLGVSFKRITHSLDYIMTTHESKSVASLNRLLQGEISAVATYDLAIVQLKDESITELGQNRECHAGRVQVLTKRIRELGGIPETKSGVWVEFTKLVERGASIIGTDTVIAALEQGEDIGLKQYREDLDDLDTTSRLVVESDLRIAQDRTHARLRDLKLARK